MDYGITPNAYTTDIQTMNNTSITPISEIALRSAALIVVALLSFFGNSLVCVTLYRRSYLLTPSNKLVFSLTTSNFVFSVLVLPFVITGSITEKWLFGRVWCSITGFLTLLVMGASTLILAAIAFDRYYAIVHPMRYPSISTGFRSTIVIIVCWVVAAVCAAPPLFGAWSRFEFQASRCGCVPMWNEQLSFAIFWFLFCFFTPYLLMIGCYAFIFKIARTKTRQVHSRIESPTRAPSQNQFFSDDSSSSDSGSYTEVSETFPTTRVIGSNSSVTVSHVKNGKIKTRADVTDATSMEDSGIMVSESNATTTHPPNGNQSRRKNLNGNGQMNLPNQVEGKDSPKCNGRKGSTVSVDNEQSIDVERQLQLQSSRKSSNASIVSSTSQVLRRTSLAFSAVKYYSNQMKAVFTIAFILGILLLTMGPFVITSLTEAASGQSDEGIPWISPIPRITLSISTCFMYLTCVYYPLIYGLWNRTVRKEMKHLLCGQRHYEHQQLTRKTRILSLTTHIQDLGMSPGLTAAIIGESDPIPFNRNLCGERNNRFRASTRHATSSKSKNAASTKRRHTLHTISTGSLLPQVSNDASSQGNPRIRRNGGISRLRREALDGLSNIGVIAEESDQDETSNNSNQSSNQQRWRRGFGVQTISGSIPDLTKIPSSSGYKMRLQTKDDILVPVSYPHQLHNPDAMKLQGRAREKPVTSGLLELSSSEVLNSEALSSALLFAGYNRNKRRVLHPLQPVQTKMTPTVLSDNNDNPLKENIQEAESWVHQPLAPENLSPQKLIQSTSENQRFENLVSETRTSERDTISIITQGRLHGSNLIHLEAGEPTKVVQWSPNQFVDFFASSVAYGVVEAGKARLKDDDQTRS